MNHQNEIDFKVIKEEISQYIEWKIEPSNIGNPFGINNRDNSNYFNNEFTFCNNTFRQLAYLYVTIFDKVSCNPSKHQTKMNDKKYYIPVDRKFSALGSQKQDIIDFFNDVILKGGYSFVCGKKGMGKTSMINHYLNRISKVMSRKERTTWFRIDMSKYEYGNSLEAHIYRQIVYVTARYYKSEKLFSGIYTKNDTFKEDILIKELQDKNIFFNLEEIENNIKYILDNFCKDDSNNNGIKPKFAQIIKDKKIEFIEIFAKAIMKYLVSKVNSVKAILILDGIDNISYLDNRYHSMIDDVINICSFNEKGHKDFHHICIVCRDETYVQIAKKANLMYNHANYKKYDIAKVEMEDLFKKVKFLTMDDATSKEIANAIFCEYKEKIDANIYLKELNEFIELFTVKIIKLIEKLKPDRVKFENVNDVVTNLFNDNIRHYIFTIFKAYTYIRLYAFSRKKECFENNTFALSTEFKDSKLFMTLILESISFGSQIYPIRDIKKECFGHMGWRWDFINILSPLEWSKISNKKSNFDTLLTIRILQILSKGNGYNIENLEQKLNMIYEGIEKILIEQIILTLSQYGYIIENFIEDEDKKEFIYRSSNKGKFAYNIFWNDIHIFYGYTTTTLLPFDLAHKIDIFENSGNSRWHGYEKSLIKGSSYMLAHLSNLNDIHQKRINNEFWTNIFKETKDNIDNLLKTITRK